MDNLHEKLPQHINVTFQEILDKLPPEFRESYERGKVKSKEMVEWIAKHPYPTYDAESAKGWNVALDSIMKGDAHRRFRCLNCKDTGWVLGDDHKPELCGCGGFDPIEPMLRHSGIPEFRLKSTFEAFDLTKSPDMKEAYDAAVEFTDGGFEPPWLLLIGKIGCGKTHLAYAAGQKLIRNNWKVRFWVVADLLDAIRSTYSESSAVTDDIMESMVYVPDVLILDDLGAERQTDWVGEKMFQILDRRYAGGRPLLVTCNKAIEDLAPRIASRLQDSAICRIVSCKGPDFRREIRRPIGD